MGGLVTGPLAFPSLCVRGGIQWRMRVDDFKDPVQQ